MKDYIPEITEELAKTADEQVKKHNADIAQLLVSASAFVAALIFNQYAHDPFLMKAAKGFHSESVENILADMVKTQSPAG